MSFENTNASDRIVLGCDLMWRLVAGVFRVFCVTKKVWFEFVQVLTNVFSAI
jgi:hypothetical protein